MRGREKESRSFLGQVLRYSASLSSLWHPRVRRRHIFSARTGEGPHLLPGSDGEAGEGVGGEREEADTFLQRAKL